MIERELQKPSFLVIEMCGHRHPHPVMNQCVRITRKQAVGRRAKGAFQKLHCLCIAQHVAESVTEMHRGSGGGFDGLIHHARSAHFQETTMSELGLGGPAQQCQAIRAAKKRSQLLAGTVPVDQKHQARAEKFEQLLTTRRVGGLMPSIREVERLLVGQQRFVSFVPRQGAALQHALEKRESFSVHVGVGHGDREKLYPDDDHVSIGRANVVLNDELIGGAGRRGRQTRMSKF